MTTSRQDLGPIRLLALLLTLATGFSALVYEVAWEKYLAILLGSHSEATAAVLGIFLAGLAYGYSLFGRVSRRLVERASERGKAPRLLYAYGLVELGIGAYVVAFPLIFTAVRAISIRLPHGPEWVSFSVDVLLSALLILPPTILMGGTIPLMTQGLSTGLADSTRFHALVYGANTAGAFFGALAAGFYLIPRLGLAGAMFAMGAVNLAAGTIFVLLEAKRRPKPAAGSQTDEQTASGGAESGLMSYAIAVLLIGFAMMAIQTTANRIVGLSVGASPFTFSTVVAVFVLSIAVGSLVVSGLSRIHAAVLPVTQWCLVAYLALLYIVVPDAPYWAHLLRSGFRDDPALAFPFRLAVFLGLWLVTLIPLALSGAALPLVFDRLRNEVGSLGRVAGRIYSWNTVGSLLGALLGGYALLFWLDLHHVYRLSVLALAVAATILTMRCLPHARKIAIGELVAVGFILLVLPAWNPSRLTSGAFRSRQPRVGTFDGPDAFFRGFHGTNPERSLLFHDDDPSATVTVVDTGDGGRAIVVNGKSDGHIPDENVTTVLLALLPAFLAEQEPERAFVVGFGTGMTAGSIASLDSIEEVTVAEISPGVIDAAPLFEELNLGAERNPKTRLQRADAYRALLRSEGSYDVISSEPSNPWVSGIEMLYSLEYLRAARARLSPGGVYIQWFHSYETDDRTLALVLETYRTAFDRVAVWTASKDDLLLVGFESAEAAVDLERLEKRWAEGKDYREGFARIGIDSLPGLLAHEVLPLGVLHEIELPTAVHTLLRPTLSHRAAGAFFGGKSARLPRSIRRPEAKVGAENSLLGRYRRERAGGLTGGEWTEIVEQGCVVGPQICATFLARWGWDEPGSERMLETSEKAREFARGKEAFSEESLLRIRVLFGAEGTVGSSTYRQAYGVLETFSRFYNHAFPFDARVLHETWRGCVGDPRCAPRRDVIESIGIEPGDEGW